MSTDNEFGGYKQNFGPSPDAGILTLRDPYGYMGQSTIIDAPSSIDQAVADYSSNLGDLSYLDLSPEAILAGATSAKAVSDDAKFEATVADLGGVTKETLPAVIAAAESIYGAGDPRGITQVLGKSAEAGLTMDDIEEVTGATAEDVEQAIQSVEQDKDKVYSTGESRDGGSIYDVLGGIRTVIFGGGGGNNQNDGGNNENDGGGEVVQNCTNAQYALLNPCECDPDYAAANPVECASDTTIITNGDDNGNNGGGQNTDPCANKPNSTYNPATESCECDTGYMDVNGVCTLISDNGGNNGNGEDTNPCANKLNSTYNPATESCECNTGYIDVDGVCNKIPIDGGNNGNNGGNNGNNGGGEDTNPCANKLNSTYNPATESCECDTGYIDVNGVCTAISDDGGNNGNGEDTDPCANKPNSTYNPNTDTCECKTGFTDVDGVCTKIPTGSDCNDPTYAALNPGVCGDCSDPAYAALNAEECAGDPVNPCANKPNSTYNTNTDTCECNTGFVDVNGVCLSIPDDGGNNGGGSDCNDPAYAAANPQECAGEEDDPCDNEVYARDNPSICSKDCPPGFVKVLGACIPLVPGNGSCPEGQVKDAGGNCVNECPSGYIDDGGQCVPKGNFCSLYPNDPRCATDDPDGNGGLTPPSGGIPGQPDFVTRDDVLVEFDKPDYTPYSILPAPVTEPYLADRRQSDIESSLDVLGFNLGQGLDQSPEAMERVARYANRFGIGQQDAPLADIAGFEEKFDIDLPDVSTNFPVRPTEPISQPRYNPLNYDPDAPPAEQPEGPLDLPSNAMSMSDMYARYAEAPPQYDEDGNRLVISPPPMFARGGVAESSDGIGSLMERRAGAVNRMLLNKAGMNFGQR